MSDQVSSAVSLQEQRLPDQVIIREMPPAADRKRNAIHSVENDPDHVLVARIVFSANPSEKDLQRARGVLSKISSLSVLGNLPPKEIVLQTGLKTAQAVRLAAALTAGRRSKTLPSCADKPVFNTPHQLYEFIKEHLVGVSFERMWALSLDSRGRLLDFSLIADGTLTTCSFSIARIVKRAVIWDADKVALVHTHPSGDVSPSHADVSVTKRVKEALELVGISLMDHLVVGLKVVEKERLFYSFKDSGLL